MLPIDPRLVEELADAVGRIPIIGELLAAFAPYDPSRQSWTPSGQERLQREAGRAGLSIPFQQWALGNVPAAWRRGGEGAYGSYAPPGPLPPSVTQALRPWAANPLLPVPGSVQLYTDAPATLAHELLHAYWATQMSPQEQADFLRAAQALAQVPTAPPEQEAEALQLLQDYFGPHTPGRMRTMPMLASGLPSPLNRLLPPAPTELHSYVGELAAGPGGLANIPAPLRRFYEPFYAVG